MEGIEKITAKILQDCEDQVRQLQEETEAKVRTLEEAARTQADRESADILARGRRAADERLERLAQRGGPGCLERFRTMWIPLEDRYIYASSQNCVYAVKAMANAAYGPLFDMSGEKQIKGY